MGDSDPVVNSATYVSRWSVGLYSKAWTLQLTKIDLIDAWGRDSEGSYTTCPQNLRTTDPTEISFASIPLKRVSVKRGPDGCGWRMADENRRVEIKIKINEDRHRIFSKSSTSRRDRSRLYVHARPGKRLKKRWAHFLLTKWITCNCNKQIQVDGIFFKVVFSECYKYIRFFPRAKDAPFGAGEVGMCQLPLAVFVRQNEHSKISGAFSNERYKRLWS